MNFDPERMEWTQWRRELFGGVSINLFRLHHAIHTARWGFLTKQGTLSKYIVLVLLHHKNTRSENKINDSRYPVQ